MSDYLVAGILLLVALINLAPIVGVRSAASLQKLYGVALEDENLVVLLRHRAVLFGLIGGLILYSVFDSSLQPLAFLFAYLSMLSYLLIVKQHRTANVQLMRVYKIDVVALLLLTLAAAIKLWA